MIGPTCKHLQIARLNYIYGTDHHEADRAIAPAAASVGVASAAGGAAGAAAGAGGGGDGNTAAGSSSVRELNSGVGASDDVSGASGASEASGGGDAARGCLRGRCGAICGASLSSAVSRQTSGLGSRARVWIGFRASEASRGRLNASDGSNGDEGSPSPDEPSSSSLLPDGDASSRAAAAPCFDMMMNGQLLRLLAAAFQPSRSRVCKSTVCRHRRISAAAWGSINATLVQRGGRVPATQKKS